MNRRTLAAGFLIQIVLLIWLGVDRFYFFAPDGFAYLSIADHYVDGTKDVLVSAYFGPLLSWLAAPLLAVGIGPLVAARLLMGAQAILFLLSTLIFARAINVPRSVLGPVFWCVVLATPYWSVTGFFVPDMLLASLILLASALLFGDGWMSRRSAQAAAGLLFGLAYLAKPIGLPIGILLMFGHAVFLSSRDPSTVVQTARATIVSAVIAIAVSAPWIVLVSQQQGSLTLSTSGPINHAIVGPDHPYPTYHAISSEYRIPPKGRHSVWENPDPDDYIFWSPLSGAEALRHQLALVGSNAVWLARIWRKFDLMAITHLGILAWLVSLFARGRTVGQGPSLSLQMGRLALLAAAVSILYLPVYSRDFRYYFAAYPAILALGLLAAPYLGSMFGRHADQIGRLFRGILIVSFAGSAIASNIQQLRTDDHRDAVRLATLMSSGNLEGPIAGVGSWSGYYVAMLTGQAYHGTSARPTQEMLEASGAAWVVDQVNAEFVQRVNRDPILAKKLGLSQIDLTTLSDDPPTGLVLYRVER